MAITDWRGDYDFLRNDFDCEIEWKFDVVGQALVFNSAEALFQAFKADFADSSDAAIVEIAEAESAREAKQLGGQVDLDVDEWDEQRESYMRRAVRAKYDQNPDLQKRLIATGSQLIVMHYRDSFWGDGGDGSGQNKLGKIHMEIRDELTRLAVAGKASVGQSLPDKAPIPLPPSSAATTAFTTSGSSSLGDTSTSGVSLSSAVQSLQQDDSQDLGDKDSVQAPDFGTDGLQALKDKYLKS